MNDVQASPSFRHPTEDEEKLGESFLASMRVHIGIAAAFVLSNVPEHCLPVSARNFERVVALACNKDASVSADAAYALKRAFTDHFSLYLDGRQTKQATKQAVANLLIDEEPSMIDEFMQLFETCCHTRAWAGLGGQPKLKVRPGGQKEIDAYVADVEGGMATTPPLGPQQSLSGVSVNGVATVANAAAGEVGAVAGAQKSSGTNPSKRRKRGPEGKLEWQAIAKKLVPEGRASYALWFTLSNIALIVAIFAYMAGDYAQWIRENPETTSQSEEAQAEILLDAARVPQYIRKWLNWTTTWQTFEFKFLRVWGARWAPALERGGATGNGAWFMWITPIYLHQNLTHIISNLLLFVAMSVHLELNYGWWRMLLVWVISGVGANLISATFEPVCTLLVGASGAVFGLMGLFVADLVVNFESISWPFARVLCIALFVVFFVVNALTDTNSPNVSHESHVGGVICGLFPSLLFLPNIRNKRVKAIQQQVEEGQGPAAGATTNARDALQQDLNQSLRASFWTRKFPFNPLYLVGGLVVVIVYIILPIYLYTSKLKSVCCSADVDTELACAPGVPTNDAADVVQTTAPIAPDADGSGTLRRLLAATVEGVVDRLGGPTRRLQREPGSSGAQSADPWGHLVVRG